MLTEEYDKYIKNLKANVVRVIDYSITHKLSKYQEFRTQEYILYFVDKVYIYKVKHIIFSCYHIVKWFTKKLTLMFTNIYLKINIDFYKYILRNVKKNQIE